MKNNLIIGGRIQKIGDKGYIVKIKEKDREYGYNLSMKPQLIETLDKINATGRTVEIYGSLTKDWVPDDFDLEMMVFEPAIKVSRIKILKK